MNRSRCRCMSNPEEPDCSIHGLLPDHLQPWYNYPENVKKRQIADAQISDFRKFLEKRSKARMLAEFLHAAQKYDDQDYIYHIDKVIEVLERFKIRDEDVIISAYLHDVVEDTQATLKLIEKHFGMSVMMIVNAVTNEHGINRKERNMKTYQKLMNEPKGIILKLADRIANLEQSIVKKNEGFTAMYKKEYPAFKYALEQHSYVVARSMWEHLDNLMEG